MAKKKCEVLITDYKVIAKDTDGVKTEVVSDKAFVVWADQGKRNTILSVGGVTDVFPYNSPSTEYTVYIDARYDMDEVKRDVLDVLTSKARKK